MVLYYLGPASTQHTTYGTCGKAADDGVTNLDSHFGEICAREIGERMARQNDWPQLIQAYRGGSDSTGGGASVADPSAQLPRSETPSTPPMEPAAKRQTTESPISTATLEKDVQEKSAI